MRHELWSDGSFFPASNRSARGLVSPGATLVWSVDAASWVEAMTKLHAHLGREPYRPMDADPGAYTAAEEEAARAEGSP